MFDLRTLSIVVVVVLAHAGALMWIQLNPTAALLRRESPELQVNLIAQAPPQSPPQSPRQPLPPKPVRTVKLTPAPTPAPALTPSEAAPTMPAAAPPSEAAPTSTPTSANAPPGPVSVSIHDIQCNTPPLIYPAMSKRMGEEGRALIQLTIGPDGGMLHAAIAVSSGFARLDRAALDSARGLRCAPYRQNGRAMTVVASKPIIFRLNP